MRHWTIRIAVLALAVLAAAGCGDDSLSVDPASVPLDSGLRTIRTPDGDREYYLDLPSDYDPDRSPRPLIIAYHGTGLGYEAWLDGTYALKSAVGNGAILIYPDAQPNAVGTKQWDFATDFAFFAQLLDELPRRLRFDPDRVYVTGHSSGGGLAHELGCRFGDRIRAIAPVAGTLTAVQCTGAVAVLQIQGSRDPLVPASIGELGRQFWVAYNGFDLDTTGPGIVAPCVDHSLGASAYPVQWCLHDEGSGVDAHDWPGFAGQAIWSFFSQLPAVAPGTAPPPGGGNERVLAGSDTTLSFTLRFPVGMGAPVRGAVVLYPGGQRQPVTGAPLAFLNLDFALGGAGPGDERSYQVPVRYQAFGGALSFPGTYAASIAIYVEGGGFPIPTAGVDYTVFVDLPLSDKSSPVLVPGVLELEPVRDN